MGVRRVGGGRVSAYRSVFTGDQPLVHRPGAASSPSHLSLLSVSHIGASLVFAGMRAEFLLSGDTVVPFPGIVSCLENWFACHLFFFSFSLFFFTHHVCLLRTFASSFPNGCFSFGFALKSDFPSFVALLSNEKHSKPTCMRGASSSNQTLRSLSIPRPFGDA